MEENPVKVAQIIGDMVGGGVEAVVMNYYRYIDRSAVQFDFIIHDTSTHVPAKEIEEMGGRIFYVPHYKKLFAYKKALLKIFKENNYSIVHSHMNTLSVFPLKVAKKAGIKVRIAHSHSTSNKKEWKRNVLKNILRRFSKKYATHYFACSEFAGRWLFGDKTFDRGEVTVINNAIDFKKFKFSDELRKSVRNALNISDRFVIGHVGRFMTQKNHTFLVDIFNEVCKKRTDAVLLLLGDGPLMAKTKYKINELSISDKVIFTGNLSNPEIYYNAMDCFVLPSLYEGLGIVCIEAQVNGLPCIVSNGVPKVAKISDKIEFLPLAESAVQWADKILDTKNSNRKIPEGQFGEYDIIKKAPELERFYLNNSKQ